MSDPKNLQDDNRVTYFGLTDFRGVQEKFGIKAGDRTRHMYVIGKTGMGKSTMLENMAIQDIQNGEGLCFIDPHGTTAEKLLKFVPKERLADVVYFAPFDTRYPMGLNMLEHVDDEYRHLVASGLMDSFKKVFGEDVFSGRMVYLLNNAVLSLLENEGESLAGINRIYSDKDYRKKIISNVKDPALLSFWNDEFAKYEDKYVKEATAAIQNKIGQFIMTPMVRNIVGQKKTSFDIREIMDKRKIMICNLSIGQTGSENLNLIGSILITKIYLAAMSRANLKEEELKKTAPFYFYVDEFQNFVNDSFAQILSQARKYNLALIIANQYVEEQLTDKVRAAIFGNVGTLISFRIGANDAEMLEKEFAPQFTAEDIVNLGARQIYLRLSIDGIGSKPFSARTMSPIEYPEEDYVPAVIAHSRAVYSRPRDEVQAEIANWYEPVVKKELRNAEYAESRIAKKYESSPAPSESVKFQDRYRDGASRDSGDNSHRSGDRSANRSNDRTERFDKTSSPVRGGERSRASKVDSRLSESRRDNFNNKNITRSEDELKSNSRIDEDKSRAPRSNALRDALVAATNIDIRKESDKNENKSETVNRPYIDDTKLRELLAIDE